jgi:predicted alpha/beta-hydrolase family hydrolase
MNRGVRASATVIHLILSLYIPQNNNGHPQMVRQEKLRHLASHTLTFAGTCRTKGSIIDHDATATSTQHALRQCLVE